MKIENFEYFYDKHLNEKCLVLGAGPSANDIDLENFDGIIISMGDMPIRLNARCKVNYWVIANSVYPLPDKDYEEINKIIGSTIIFSNSVAPNLNYNVIEQNLKLDWFEYDQRHFKGRPCNNQIDNRFSLEEPLDCCKSIGETTIQEFVQKKYNMDSHYSTGSTVAIHALALAIILGCKTIYISGVDIPIQAKSYTYANQKSVLEALKNERGKYIPSKYFVLKFLSSLFNLKSKSVFYNDIPEILNDFQYLNNLCNKSKIKLFNLSKYSTLNKIPNFKYLNPKEINAR